MGQRQPRSEDDPRPVAGRAGTREVKDVAFEDVVFDNDSSVTP